MGIRFPRGAWAVINHRSKENFVWQELLHLPVHAPNIAIPSTGVTLTFTKPAVNDNHRLLRQGLLLEYLTLGWNVIGSAVLGFAAIEGRSNALAGFALDSVIEIGASMAVIWQLRGVGADRQPRALKMIAWAFFAMAVYIAAQAAHGFVRGSHAGSSPMGAAWLTVTAVVMFALAAGKSRIGLLLGNEVLKAEGRVTMIDGMLALSVLTGLLLNTLAGCRWADPLASLVIVFYGVREGIHAWTASRKCVTTGVHR